MAKSSREVIKLLKSNGWTLSHIRGSHHYFMKDGYKPVTVTHPRKDLAIGPYEAILKQARSKIDLLPFS